MDSFDKLYKQSKVNRSSSPNNTTKWFKNATRSISHSAFDVVSSFMPATMDTTVSLKDVQNDLRESFIDTKKVGIMKTGSLMSLGKELWNNSIEDLKSGNFHNQGRIDRDESKSMGFDMEDFDFGESDFGSFSSDDYNFDMTSDDGLSSVQMKKKTGNGNEVTQINIETNLGKDSAVVQATEQQTQISVKTAQQLADVSNSNTKIMMTHLSKIGKTINGQLATINNNISAVSTIISESMTAHMTVASKYYEDSLELFRSMNDTLISMNDRMIATASAGPTNRSVSDYNSVLDLFSMDGGLNLKSYSELVKKQFKNYVDSSPIGLVMSLTQMSSMGANEWKSSPISTAITAGMKAIIPGVVKTAMSEFDEQLKETLATGLFKLRGATKSSNPIMNFIGQVFGIQNTKYNVDKSNYNKGPMPWNGIAHRTLVDVIPNYLSQIAAAVTGTEQKVFDYSTGKYASLASIRKEHDRIEKREQLSPYYDITSEFRNFIDKFDLSSNDKSEYRDKFDKYLLDIVKSSGNMNFNNTAQLVNSVGDEQVAKMIQQFMRIAPKSMVTAAYGRNALEANENISRRNKRIEEDPTAYNYQYINNGMATISPNGNNGLIGSKVDKYNHDNLYYLRKILQTINTVVPVRIIKGGKGFNNRVLTDLGTTSNTTTATDGTTTNSTTSASTSNTSSSRKLSMDSLNLSSAELKEKLKENAPWWENKEVDRDPASVRFIRKFGVKEDSNLYKIVSNIAGTKRNASNKGASIFNKMGDTLFALLFGDESGDGPKGALNMIINGVKTQMSKFGHFIDEKMIGPLNESLFGDDGLITKISQSETINNIKTKLSSAKNTAVNFLFGEKDGDGKRKGGLFSDTLNSLSEMGTSAKDFILHDENGIVGSMKGMFHSVTESVKRSLGVESEQDKPKVSISERIASGASDFLTHIKSRGSEWIDLIFGGAKTESNLDETRDDIIAGFDIFKSDMKGKKGKLGASATLGILGSFFLPGGPIAGALLGLGAGIVSESSQLKDFLFGKLGDDGERAGNGIISKEFQDFFKDNKTGISVGAFAGIASSIGLLPAFFVPGGPIGGALIGGAISLAHKSGAFNDLIYGEGGTEDNITGGITKFIKDHYKKDANIKSTFMDAGIGAGVGILGSFFLPGGPITGALLGSATSIAINTDKFKNLMFGEEELDENGNATGKRKGGLFGKFTTYIGDKVLLPLSKAGKVAQVKMLGFIEKNMVNPLKAAMKPFQLAGKNFMDGVKGTIDDLKESFKARVTKPIGDSVQKHILDPMKNAFSKIFGGLGKIVGSFISAPFKMIQGMAGGLNKSQVKSGQTEYDINAELDRLNSSTESKQEDKLKQVQKENDKRKKWYNPLTRGTKKSSTKSSAHQNTVTSSDDSFTSSPHTNDEQGTGTKVRTADTPNMETTKKFNGTRMSMPIDLQFFASSSGNGDYKSQVLMRLSSLDDSVKSIFNRLIGQSDGSSEFSTNSSESIEKSLIPASLEANVKIISDSVDGQLNGVGYNVNKILKILLKKNGMTEEEVSGENNKKYSRGGRLKNILFAPFRFVKNGVNGVIEAAKGVISGVKDGIIKAGKGLLEIPKTIVKIGTTAIKGIGTAAIGVAKGVGNAIQTGLSAVGNVISSAATGFGEMIGKVSEGFGQLLGGALGGLGNLLHAAGLIGKELGPVIAKGISSIIGVPFKLAGAAGSFISNLFGKGNGSGTKAGKISHIIVDEYKGEDRIIGALKAIEFAILYGTPMDGEGPKFKGSQSVPEGNGTRMSLPIDLQFFANPGRNGNGLPDVTKATNQDEEKLELATRVAEGSASEMNERFDAEDDKKEERGFREKLLGLFKSNNQEQKKQGFNWSSIFSKKGLITGALLLAVPLIIKLLPKIGDILGNLGEKLGNWLGDTATSVVNNAESQGGITGMINGVSEQVTSVQNLLNTKQREEYTIGKNGEILTDENGNPIKTSYDDNLGTRISEFYTPTTTKIDHETGEAYQMQQYDAVSRAKLNTTRQIAAKGVRTGKKIVGAAKSTKQAVTKAGSKVADVAATAAIHVDDLTHSSIATSAYDAVAKVAKKPGEMLGSAKTTVKSAASGKVDEIMKLGKEAFEAVGKKFTELIQKHAPNSKGLSKLTEFLAKAAEKVFNIKTITKHISKFGKILSKVATAAGTLLTSEVFWGITGAVEGATNAAYTFEVSSDAVDWKMRLIAGVFRALLSTSIGGFVDIADSILYEITGTSFVNELANLVYSIMSNDEDTEALRQAQAQFDESYNKYVEEEYEAYKKNQEENGQAAMSYDEFKQSDLSTSRQEYNSEQNKSIFKKGWDAIKGAPHNIKKGLKKGTTKIKEGATWVKDKVTGGASWVKDKVSGAKDAVVSGAKNLGATVKEKWDNSKLKSMVDTVTDVGSTILSGITSQLKYAWTGDKEDLISLPSDSDDPSLIVKKVALIGSKIMLTPITMTIKAVRGLVGFAQKAWKSVTSVSSIVSTSTQGRIQAAWNGEDYEPVSADSEDNPLGKIGTVVDIANGVLMSPMILTIKAVRGVIDFAKTAWNGAKAIGGSIVTSATERVKAAWNGEDYEPVEDESNPLGKLGTTIDMATGVVLSPVVTMVKGARVIYEFAKTAWNGAKAIGGSIVTSATERVKAAWNGEDYEPVSADSEDNPLGQLGTAVDMVTGIVISPVTATIKGLSSVVKGVKSAFSVLKNLGTSITTYANVFGDDTDVTISNYWENPDKDDESGFGLIKTIMFYTIRGALAIPFYLSSAVKALKEKLGGAVKGIANKVLNLFGEGTDAFNVDDGGSGGMGGFGSPTKVSKSNLNGFTYYSQNDSSIKDQSYNQTDGTPGTMGERGCGPTALSMVASELTGKDYDPMSMARIAENNGYSTDVGTTTGYFGQVGSQLGMGVSAGRANPSAIKSSLQNGNPVILQGAGGGNTPYTSQGHYVVGVGMQDGKVLVNDPRGAQYSKAYSMDDVMNGAAGMWSFSGGKGPSDHISDGYTHFSSQNDTKTTTSNSSADAEQALVNAMYSVKDKLSYSQSDRDRVGDALTTGHGSGDCSSTVRWAYQQTVGIDPGSYTGAQIGNSAGINVDASNGGSPNEANLRPGDLLFYTKSGRGTHAASDVGHVEMYVGNGKLMGHGGGKDGTTPGPTEKDMASYRVADYIGAKRFIGDGTSVVNSFDGVSSPSSSVSGTSTVGVSSSTSNGTSSGGFSLSNLISGAVSAVSKGISDFFGLSSSEDSSATSSYSSSSSTDTGTGTGATASISVTPDQAKTSIWTTLTQRGFTPAGTAGLMGNIHKESGLMPNNLQNTANKSLGMTDEQYTQAVDNGSYNNFINDKKGYGLCQWTTPGRKEGLFNLAKSRNTSIADPSMQADWLYHEISSDSYYKDVFNTLTSTSSVRDASNVVLHKFEEPADQSTAEENERAGYAQSYYDALVNYKPNSATDTSNHISDGYTHFSNQNNTTGGNGNNSNSKLPKISTYQSNSMNLGGMGQGNNQSNTTQTQTSKIQTPSIPVYNSTPVSKSINPSDIMNKLFEYLGKMVGYLESTSSGIAQLNQKDFGGNSNSNYVNSPSYTNVNGGTQQQDQPDTSNYDLGRLIAQGQLT